MKKISVENVSENGDKLFIKIWYVFLIVTLAVLLMSGSRSTFGYVGILILLVFGTALFYRTRWAVVDEAFDCDDHLIFRKDGRDYQVQVSDIEELGHPFANSIDLITVKVRTKRSLSKKFTFRAAKQSGWFKVHPIFYELKGRVEATKRE